ncbi:hypothetical protein F0562_025975 [Nyssa sinensis]|uniref:Amino acid transporter transmembrane domain-containing protein n=1 Tax=Nyssa sinensis TaxID=561372 RepID=A0A5J5B7R4_9ASTE|nr:hypothetical protein F0562_025975 [Nyssa sinensis]
MDSSVVVSVEFSRSFVIAELLDLVDICSVMVISTLLKEETKRPRMLPQLDNEASFFNLFTIVPIIVTAFTFHFNVHPIGVELSRPFDMKIAVRISIALCAAVYFAVGIFGYLLFGDSIMDDILVNFDQSSGSTISSLLNDIVRLSYALHKRCSWHILALVTSSIAISSNIYSLIGNKS